MREEQIVSQKLSGLRRLAAALCAAAMPAILGMPAAGLAQEVVNIGVQPATMPVYIARAMGLLEAVEKKHNVKFEFHSFSYGAPENQAMAAGELQLASAGMGPAIVAAARLPAKLLAITILEQTAILVPQKSPIAAVAELKGKTVAHPGKGSQQYPLLVKALADAGLTVDDVKLFKTKGSDIPTLVGNGDIDAGITWDPHVSKALASGGARVLIKAEKIMPIKAGHYIGNGFYGREDFIARRPEVVQDVMTAIVKAVDLILDDPEQAAQLWVDEIGFPLEVINFSLKEGISVYTRDMVPAETTVAAYTKFLKDAEILGPDDNPKVDPSFAEKALQMAK
jgi:aliphatic sulfonates family ABC transporter substrate-binding protein